MRRPNRSLSRQDGATSLEYGIMLVLVAATLIALVVFTLSDHLG